MIFNMQLQAGTNRTWFLTRLPATYNECTRVISEAVASDQWIDIEKVPKYGRGRPAQDKPRAVLRYEYQLTATIKEASEKVDPLRQEAGCFVLLTNLLDQQADWTAHGLLTLYKSQIGIEKNFHFLKDPPLGTALLPKDHRHLCHQPRLPSGCADH